MKFTVALIGLLFVSLALVSGCSKAPPTLPEATTLHQAAVFYPDQIPRLLNDGATVDQLDANGSTALWTAVRHSKGESVRLLLAAGADPDVRGQRGWTALHCCTFCNHDSDGVQIAKLLLQHGADPNAVAPQYGETPLHYATKWQSVPLVQLLLDSGAAVDATTTKGDTALQSAVSRGNTAIADILLTSGSNSELRNMFGFRPIDQLNSCPNPKDIQLVFRKHNADDTRRPELFKSHEIEEQIQETL